MSTILLLKGASQYDAMRKYIEEIELGLRIAGYDTYTLDVLEQSSDFQIEELANSVKIDMIFTCNAIMIEDIGCDIRTIFPEAYYVTYLCDHPAAHLDRLKALNERSIVFTCDRHHEHYIKRYCPNIKNVQFIPLSGSFSMQYVPYMNRTNDIVFTGSYGKPEKFYLEFSSYDEQSRIVAKYMAENILQYPEQDLEVCLRNTLTTFGITVSDSEFHELAGKFCLVDRYARFYYRDAMIRILVKNGIKIHVFGNGWEEFDGEGKENLIIEKGNQYVALKAVANAKISLNIMPWFKDGFQERIATAMLSGAIAVTDESAYILDNFVDQKEIVLYTLKNLEELPTKIKWLLKNPDEAERIALTGKKRAEQALTWQHRTYEMIEFWIQKCPQLRPKMNKAGEMLQIPYKALHNRQMRIDTIQNMDGIIRAIEHIRKNDKIELCDIQYFYATFFLEFLKIRANYPEVSTQIGENIYSYLMGISEEQTLLGAEILIRECANIMVYFLKWETNTLLTENQDLQSRLVFAQTKPNLFTQQMLIKKLNMNYQPSKDKDIEEILTNINLYNSVEAYNQNFIKKYSNETSKFLKTAQYDPDAEMYFVLWNGRKMYYPKGHTKEMAASNANFSSLEQDEASPHRYLDDTFNVQEGDIVIDAGVAEGNFALDVVERAKKIYLVECDHKWIEALERTFEPWADKVVIIEKMLGDRVDEQYTSIDHIVKEGYANFIKMDVEGAEIPALKGAAKVLKNSKNIKCAICAYHRKNAENDIRQYLEKHQFYTTVTNGYMFFKEDMDSWIDGELRHGIVRAQKI